MPRKLKIKIYETVIRPVMLYRAETWALRKREEEMIKKTEIKMLQWTMEENMEKGRSSKDE